MNCHSQRCLETLVGWSRPAAAPGLARSRPARPVRGRWSVCLGSWGGCRCTGGRLPPPPASPPWSWPCPGPGGQGAGLDIAKKNSRVTKEGKPVNKSQTRQLFASQSPNIRDGATASTKALGPTHFNPLADGRIKMGKQLFVELKLP